ncbi:cytochrome P450 1A5-like isoform X1 [Pelodiscus sinensis]|uniref:cytochrome P450 1A5-like isoform X1 n=1 Tax=Pelodiscus sinensis TaxID=13735 RepID=UPI003F6D2AC2
MGLVSGPAHGHCCVFCSLVFRHVRWLGGYKQDGQPITFQGRGIESCLTGTLLPGRRTQVIVQKSERQTRWGETLHAIPKEHLARRPLQAERRHSAGTHRLLRALKMEAAISLAGSQGTISVTEILVASAVFCLISLVIRSFRQQLPQGLKRLPGPWGYPLIGNLLELGSNPHLTLTRMSQEYGDVMQIRIGTRPVLVLSGLDTLKQALVKQAEDFMGRPDLYSFRFIADGQSMTFSTDSGEVWRARRKLAQSALKTFSVSPSPNSSSTCLLEEHVSKEADYLVRKFLQLMEEKKRFEPYRYVVVSVANVICAMCFGKRYSDEDQELLNIVNVTHEFTEVASSGNLADFIPVLQCLPSRTMKKFIEFNRRFLRLLQDMVKEHDVSFEKGSIRDITDSLIEQSQEKKVEANANIQLPKEKIVNLVNDLFGAGFDTVTTALSWSLMYLVSYPDVQKKIQEELDQTVGRERRPRLSDRPMLPYTEAFILEMFRHSTFMPFTIPHCTTKDTVLNGYYIPKNLCVFVNQWQVNHDEKLWKEPSAFNPERFLSAGGTEVDKAESEKVLAFGLGKRRCIGETIGRWEIFLFLTTLLQQLEFSVSDGEEVDMTPLYGLSMKHKRCEHFQAKQRLPRQSSE